MKTYFKIILITLFLATQSLLYGKDLSNAIVDANLKAAEKIVKSDPASVNKKIPEKGYPLILAVSKLRVDIVKLLLDNGADINVIDPETKENIVFRLLDQPQTTENLKKAIQINSLLAAKHADFNVINAENMTPLYAFSTGRQSLNSLDTKMLFLQALIDAGAKTDIKLKRDLPLLNAVLMKVLKSNPDHIEVAKLLIKNGVPLNEKSKKNAECSKMTSVVENDTPLLIVIKREGFQTTDKSEMIKILVENGAKKTARNKKKETPKKLIDHKSPYYDALYKTKVKKH
jgi:ankyrin repeat protein